MAYNITFSILEQEFPKFHMVLHPGINGDAQQDLVAYFSILVIKLLTFFL